MKTIARKLSLLWVSLYFSAMTVWMTWPLATRMRDSMVGEVGDNIYFVWMIGWLRKALFELGVNPFDVWFLNYPEGWNLAYTEITPSNLLIALPFSLIGGPMFGYNMALLLSFVLAGVGMYLWVRQMTASAGAGLVAGTVFAFLPYHFAHFLIGHLNLSAIQWFPFYFMGFFKVLQQRNWSWKPVLVGGLALGLIALTSQYYFYITVLISGFLVIVYLLWVGRGRIKDPVFWKNLVGMGLVSLPLVAAGVAPFAILARQGGLPDRGISVARLYSASPTDFLLPSTDHFLFGSWVGKNFNRDLWIEATLYIGLFAGILAVIAYLKRKDLPQRDTLRLMFWGALLSIILAMGTDLHWNGAPVEIDLPGFLASRLGRTEAPIPLPGYFLFLYFPFYAKMRALMRFGVVALVFTSAAAGIGSAWLLNKFGNKWQTLATVGLLGLVIFDFSPGPYRQFAQVEPRSVDRWLAEQPDQGVVIQMPFVLAEDQEQTYYTLFHEKPYVGGFFNAFPPPQYSRIRPVLEHFPDEESVRLMRELGVNYVLVQTNRYDDPDVIRQECERLGLDFEAELDGQLVYLLNGAGNK